MSKLFTIDKIDSFSKIKTLNVSEINEKVLKTIKSLDEKNELEPFIRSCIYDFNDTPHGPSEIVDILTHKLKVNGKEGLAAFIIKGKSFKKINAQDVSHQIYRLKKINGLNFVIFAYTGNILDQPKEEFCTTANEIGSDYSFFDSLDLARLFISEGIICPRDGNIIEGEKCMCGYKPSRNELNILQQEAIKELKVTHVSSLKSGLIILPPGTGKTRIAAQDIKSFKAKKVLYIAHTHEILDVAEDEFMHVFNRNNVKRIVNKEDFTNLNKINLTTIQLINNYSEDIEGIDYVVVDEFHHAAARTYQNVINKIKPNFLLGMTATPFRSDRKDIFGLCNDNLIVEYELRSGIDFGILSPYHYIGCFDNINYSNIKHNGISYDIKDLEKVLIIQERYESILKKWKNYLLNKPTIAFCCSINHAQRCCAYFNKKKVTSAIYVNSTSRQQRIKIKDDFKSGHIKVIFTVDVLNEGADFPYVEGLMFLRPTESKRIFLQQLGRGLRRYSGKTEVIILDFIGNFMNAYKITDYLSSTSSEKDRDIVMPYYNKKRIKDLLNLPLNCKVTFEDKVIDIFCNQIINNRQITKHNIGKILIFNYYELSRRLKRLANNKEIDRYSILHSDYYKTIFGDWRKFMTIIKNDDDFLNSLKV